MNWFVFDWSDLNLGGDEDDDDPNVPDEDESSDDEVTDPPEQAEEAPAAEEGAPVDAEKAAGTQEPVKEEPTAPTEPVFTKTQMQAEIDRVVAQRLAREKAATERRVQEVTGRPLDALLQEHRQAQITALQESHLMSPEQATAYVAQQEEVTKLRAEKEQLEETTRIATYDLSKADLASNPYFKELEADVDAFTQNGATGLDFAAGFSFALGQKLLKGELKADIQKTAEQKAIRSMQKAAKAAPISGAATAGSAGHGLNAAQLSTAKRLGLTAKEYAAGLTSSTDDE